MSVRKVTRKTGGRHAWQSRVGLDQLGPMGKGVISLRDAGLMPPPRKSKRSLNERAAMSTRARRVKITLPKLASMS